MDADIQKEQSLNDSRILVPRHVRNSNKHGDEKVPWGGEGRANRDPQKAGEAFGCYRDGGMWHGEFVKIQEVYSIKKTNSLVNWSSAGNNRSTESASVEADTAS